MIVGEYVSKSIKYEETVNIGGDPCDIFSIEQDQLDSARYAANRAGGDIYVVQVEDDSARSDGRIDIVLDPGESVDSVSEKFVSTYKTHKRA